MDVNDYLRANPQINIGPDIIKRELIKLGINVCQTDNCIRPAEDISCDLCMRNLNIYCSECVSHLTCNCGSGNYKCQDCPGCTSCIVQYIVNKHKQRPNIENVDLFYECFPVRTESLLFQVAYIFYVLYHERKATMNEFITTMPLMPPNINIMAMEQKDNIVYITFKDPGNIYYQCACNVNDTKFLKIETDISPEKIDKTLTFRCNAIVYIARHIYAS